MPSLNRNPSQTINPDVLNDNTAGLYSKGMSHDSTTGLPDLSDVKEIQVAILSASQADFNTLEKAGARKQTNPQASLSLEKLTNLPSFTMPAPPAIASREAAAEMVEVYEMALLKDKTFSTLNEGGADADADRAVSSLNAFGADFKGPKEGGVVTRKSLFRGVTPGELVGPYVSQLLLRPVVFGAHSITQQYVQRTGQYGITAANWLSIQNGDVPVAQTLGSTRYCSTPRDLASIAHVDYVYQQFLYAALILQSVPTTKPRFPALAKEAGFITYGGPVDIGCAVTEIARHALKAAWIQKWFYHLKTRPEAMAGLVVKQIDGDLPSGTVHADLLSSVTIDAVEAANLANGGDSKAWLPLGSAEGSPTHPSYPAGHAAIAGACVTLLKLYFGDAAWSTTGLSAVESLDGSSLTAYAGGDAASMTIHGELNKIASNIALGRNMLGVHYRADGDKGMILGEEVALQYWSRLTSLENEAVQTASFVKFDGTTITI